MDSERTFSREEQAPVYFFGLITTNEIATSFAFSFFQLAWIKIGKHDFGFVLVGHDNTWYSYIPLPFLLLLSHVIYKVEHNKTNVFWGRWVQDLMFMVFSGLVLSVYGLIQGNTISLNWSFIPAFISASLIIMMCLIVFETLVAMLRKVFKVVGCEIF